MQTLAVVPIPWHNVHICSQSQHQSHLTEAASWVLAPKTERWEEKAGMPLTSWVTLEHAEPHVCHLPMEALSNPVSQPGVR